jgi:hypothetical protein
MYMQVECDGDNKDDVTFHIPNALLSYFPVKMRVESSFEMLLCTVY